MNLPERLLVFFKTRVLNAVVGNKDIVYATIQDLLEFAPMTVEEVDNTTTIITLEFEKVLRFKLKWSYRFKSAKVFKLESIEYLD